MLSLEAYMVRLGVHVSVAGGLFKAVDRAQEKGCDAFQIFTSNPRAWRSKPISADCTNRFVARLRESKLSPAVAHMPYLPNLASPRVEVHAKSVQALSLELMRCQTLSIPYLVTHLGSHLGEGRERGLERIMSALDTALSLAKNDVVILIENSAGTRNSMGSTFSEIASLLESQHARRRLGVCLDTCHLFAAGYDLRTSSALEKTLGQFQEYIDLERLRLMHLNDCKGPLGSHLDRHEHIGLGHIGESGFRAILSHPAVLRTPMILETPEDSRRDDRGNLDAARSLASGIK
jgi:deoxyribonuclease-4